MNQDLHQGKWTKITGHQLEGKTVAIIGFGRIGKKVAALLLSFGVKVFAVDIDKHNIMEGVQFCPLYEALSEADIISIHVSGNDEIIGKEAFKHIKQGALLLNAARGEAINEGLLIAALESGQIKGAWLDVFVDEPYSGLLQKFPQVLLTPHVGSYTEEGRKTMEMDTVNNLIDVLKDSYDHTGH